MKRGTQIGVCIGAALLTASLFLCKVPMELTVLKKDIVSGKNIQMSASDSTLKAVTFEGDYQVARASDGRLYGFKETLSEETRWVPILDYLGYKCGYRDCNEAEKLEMTLNGRALAPTSSFKKLGH